MRLYHYRPIESALLEIGNGTFHFAAREELNDPIEGYARVFWQGDKAAWEGLFRNYVCSVGQAVDLYLLQGDEDMLHHKSLIVDLHCFDDVPLGNILKKLGDMFLADEEIQKLAGFYGNNRLKVREEELRLILHFVHSKALVLYVQQCLERKAIPDEMANSLLEILGGSKKISFPFELIEEELPDEELRASIAKTAENIIEDMKDFQYVKLGFDDETFLYGKPAKEDAITEARQRRNWLAVAVDFPRIYVTQLKDMIYPESYVVCFSGRNDDSAMWGNYADNHRGVCLIYDTDEENRMDIKIQGQNIFIEAKPVSYEGEMSECNFFENFGRLSIRQITTWLTGTEGLSSCYNVFVEKQAWRDRYWEIYNTKTYRKLKAWEHENEYRLALANTFYDFNESTSRNLRYDWKAFKGLIFGINTSEYDKKRIMEKLLEHMDELTDFTFYQAEYDDEMQRVRIRKKFLSNK